MSKRPQEVRFWRKKQSWWGYCWVFKEIQPFLDSSWPRLQTGTTWTPLGTSGTPRRAHDRWFWRRRQSWWGYCHGIKEIEPVLDFSWPGLQTGTTWTSSGTLGLSRRPQDGWFWRRRQSWWDGVEASRRFKLFWIPDDQGYKLGLFYMHNFVTPSPSPSVSFVSSKEAKKTFLTPWNPWSQDCSLFKYHIVRP